jgi:hypothetical protein
MKVPAKLDIFIDEILNGTHSYEEWLELETEVNAYLKELTDEQQDYFTNTGAGELLWMICSAIRNIKAA